jgi:hypothetical protein
MQSPVSSYSGRFICTIDRVEAGVNACSELADLALRYRSLRDVAPCTDAA